MAQNPSTSPTSPVSPTRYYTSHSHYSTKYVLPADDEEKTRLGRQHLLLVELFDEQLLPPEIILKPGQKVLDSGCGPGFWALDLARKVPEGVTIQGFDIEPRLLPPSHPANTAFSVHSMMDLPAAWSNTFDVAHQRLMIAALDWPGWQKTLQSLYRVLKPGGYLVLVDHARANFQLPDTEGIDTHIPYTQRFGVITERLFVARNLIVNCGERLPFLVKEAGFEDVEIERKTASFGPGPEDGPEWKENSLGIVKGLKGPVLKMGGFGLIHSEEEWDDLVTHMEEEWAQHKFVGDYVRIVARKPEQAGYHAPTPAQPDEGFP